MTDRDFAHLLSVVDQQADAQEELSELLRKLEAMMQVAVSAENFLDFEESTIHYFLWSVNDCCISQRKE